MIHTCAFCGSVVEVRRPVPGADRAAEIIRLVSKEHDVSVLEMMGPRRTPRVCMARDCAMSLLREEGFLLKEIGHFLGNRNHATVIHALRRWEEVKAMQSLIDGLSTSFSTISTEPAVQTDGLRVA